MNDKDAIVALNAVKGIGNKTIMKLIEHFSSAKNVLVSSLDHILSAQIVSEKTAENIKLFDADQFLNEEYALTNKHNVKILTPLDSEYPFLLKNIDDQPQVLYIKGDIDYDDFRISIVGSRKASIYGMSMAEKLSYELSQRGVTIVSGLARGIDTAAHRGALKANGKTIGVLGCGLTHIYPKENKDLFNEVIRSGGAIISEFPMQLEPLAFNFPRRNRIVSGLTQGLLVVEASQRSGALITSDFALQQGREVFAIPGKIDHPNSFGVHKLIKQGSKLVSDVDDILEEFHIPSNNPSRINHVVKTKVRELNDFTEYEREVFNHINDHPVHIDELIHETNSPNTEMLPALLKLELKGLVKQLPGKLFVEKN